MYFKICYQRRPFPICKLRARISERASCADCGHNRPELTTQQVRSLGQEKASAHRCLWPQSRLPCNPSGPLSPSSRDLPLHTSAPPFLTKSNLSVFPFAAHASDIVPENPLPHQRHKDDMSFLGLAGQDYAHHVFAKTARWFCEPRVSCKSLCVLCSFLRNFKTPQESVWYEVGAGCCGALTADVPQSHSGRQGPWPTAW